MSKGDKTCKTPAKSTTAPDPKTPVEECPLKKLKHKLVELVEVTTYKGTLYQVKGAAGESTKIEKKTERVVKDGVCRQYANLDPALDDGPHADYGRSLTFRARIAWEDESATESLAGKEVWFRFKRHVTSGDGRPSEVKSPEKEEFTGGGNPLKTTTDAEGWATVTLKLSQYAGDQFTVSAGLAEAAAEFPTKKYVVWRKYWYQMTRSDGVRTPDLGTSVSAWKEHFTEMVEANTKAYKKTDDGLKEPAVKNVTWIPRYKVDASQSTDEVIVIGNHNKQKFFDLFVAEAKTRPLKLNLIPCNFQCDYGNAFKDIGTVQVKTTDKTTEADTYYVTVATNTRHILCDPPLNPGVDRMIVSATYGHKDGSDVYAADGNIPLANITIDEKRPGTGSIKLKRPGTMPEPTVAKPVWVRVEYIYCRSYLGESKVNHVLAVVRPWSASGQGSPIDFNDTVTHEIGHAFNQTPRRTTQPASLGNHPTQYYAHGGQGSHCHQGSASWSPSAPAENANLDTTAETPVPSRGKCVMFHSFSADCEHKFCDKCKPYVRLQDMSSMKSL